MKFTEEQLEKAKQSKTEEELLAFAKESGIELTEEEAAKRFAELQKEEIADDELNAVSGGYTIPSLNPTVKPNLDPLSKRPPAAAVTARGIYIECPNCSYILRFMGSFENDGDPYDRYGCANGHAFRWYNSDHQFTFDTTGAVL